EEVIDVREARNQLAGPLQSIHERGEANNNIGGQGNGSPVAVSKFGSPLFTGQCALMFTHTVNAEHADLGWSLALTAYRAVAALTTHICHPVRVPRTHRLFRRRILIGTK